MLIIIALVEQGDYLLKFLQRPEITSSLNCLSYCLLMKNLHPFCFFIVTFFGDFSTFNLYHFYSNTNHLPENDAAVAEGRGETLL